MKNLLKAFENVGGTIKKYAIFNFQLMFYLYLIAGVVGTIAGLCVIGDDEDLGLILFLLSIPAALIVIVINWIYSWFIYAIGDHVENTNQLRLELCKTKKDAVPDFFLKHVPAKTKPHQSAPVKPKKEPVSYTPMVKGGRNSYWVCPVCCREVPQQKGVCTCGYERTPNETTVVPTTLFQPKAKQKKEDDEVMLADLPKGFWQCPACGKLVEKNQDHCPCGYKR